MDFRYAGLTAKQLRAAGLLAEDVLPDERIAEEVGISRKTLHNWKQEEEFRNAVRDKIAELDAAVSRYQFVKRRNRIALMNRQVEDYNQIVQERADWFTQNDPDVPGGKTGRIVKQVKQIGVGKAAELVEEYVLDKGLETQIQATLKQIAQERGEWTEKREHTGPGGTPLIPITEIVIAKQAAPPDDDDD